MGRRRDRLFAAAADPRFFVDARAFFAAGLDRFALLRLVRLALRLLIAASGNSVRLRVVCDRGVVRMVSRIRAAWLLLIVLLAAAPPPGAAAEDVAVSLADGRAGKIHFESRTPAGYFTLARKDWARER